MLAIGGNAEALGNCASCSWLTCRQAAPALLAQLRGDAGGVQALLHKLKASCGFVGASRLSRAVEALADSPMDAALLDAFGHHVRDALDTAGK